MWHDPALADARAGWSLRGGQNKANAVRVTTAMKKSLPGSLTLAEVTALVGKSLIDAASGRMAPGQAAGVASLARAYAMLAQLARVTISLDEAKLLMDTLGDSIVAAKLPDELRDRIVAEWERRTGPQVAA